jgi:hypothetical protein
MYSFPAKCMDCAGPGMTTPALNSAFWYEQLITWIKYGFCPDHDNPILTADTNHYIIEILKSGTIPCLVASPKCHLASVIGRIVIPIDVSVFCWELSI